MSYGQQELPLKVAFYLRVSTEDQVEKYGKDLQKTAIEAFVASRGKLDDGKTDAMSLASEAFIYVDEGISGTTPLEERPEFARLMEDIRHSDKAGKPFDVVAVYKMDRFARRLKILLEAFEFLNSYDIQVISTRETIDTSTPFGRAILGIVGVLAELEMETIRQRTIEGKAEARKAGVFMGSVPPYGYNKDENKHLIILDAEAEIVRKIYDMYLLENIPITTIGRELANLKVYSPSYSATVIHKKRRGKPHKKQNPYFWNTSMVRKILSDEIYIGNYYYDKNKDRKAVSKDKWVKSPFKHQALIDDGTFYKVQKLLDLQSKRHYQIMERKDKHIYLLSGVLKCASCFDEQRDVKNGMQSWHGEPRNIELASGEITVKYSYRCRRKNTGKTEIRCSTLPLPAEQIEDYVVERIKDLLKDPRAVYDYQTNLKSTKNYIKLLETQKRFVEKFLNAFDTRVKNIKEQHKLGYLTNEELKNQINEEEETKKLDEKKLNDLKLKISQNALSEGYIKTIEIFKQKYEKTLYNVTASRAELQNIISLLVDNIVIHSRELTEKDIVAGKKSENQKIPFRIDIKLKLPHEYLLLLKEEVDKSVIEEIIPQPIKPEDISDKELKAIGVTRKEYEALYLETIKEIHFGVEKPIWWGRRESNPRQTA